jgi:hypothetical protein
MHLIDRNISAGQILRNSFPLDLRNFVNYFPTSSAIAGLNWLAFDHCGRRQANSIELVL